MTTSYQVTTTDVSESTTNSTQVSLSSVTPSSAALNYGNAPTSFTANGGSVTLITTTIPAHTKYTFNGETYYYYNNIVYTSTDGFKQSEVTNPAATYTWTISGAAATNLSVGDRTSNTNTVSYTTPALNSSLTATLSVYASYNGANSSTVTATLTANQYAENPTSIMASPDALGLQVGETETITYSLTSPTSGAAYDHVTFTSSNPLVATVDPNTGFVTAVSIGQTIITLTAYQIDGTSVACTATCAVTVQGRCATPTITRANNGKYVLECTTEGAIIYYTTNGSTPTSSSTQYTAPFNASAGATIKAIAVKTGYLDSNVASTTIGNGATADSPYLIFSQDDLSQIASNPAGFYRVEADFTMSSSTTVNYFNGNFDGNYHVISGVSAPLFTNVNGATIKNVVLDNVNIATNAESVGAIVGEASGTTRIYNCGILATSSSTISGRTNVGGIAGSITGATKVVNCYSFANITGGNNVAGIVGRNQGTSATASNYSSNTVVMNCMFYGDLTGGSTKYPVFGGNNISNNNGLNTYNYFVLDNFISGTDIDLDGYNCALPISDISYLTRFEFFRGILNAHKELAAIYCLNDVGLKDEIGKWVLDKEIAPYPIIKPWESNTRKTLDRDIPFTVNDYAGKQVNTVEATVVINGSSYLVSLPVTDMDTLNYDYTYGKVVLPFANEFTGWTPQTNSSQYLDKIIIGWKITSMTGGTTGSFSISGENAYNFADPNCTAKDLYTNTGYVFAQGGNLVVPTGVTRLTITAHWANAVYLSDNNYDFSYGTDYATTTGLGGTVPNTYNEKTVQKTLTDAFSRLSTTSSVFDQAIVLVGNYHYNQKSVGTVFPSNTGKAVTIMSIDADKDQEPDYCWYSYHTTDRTNTPPIRFDFLVNPGMGMAARVTGSTPNPTIGIWHSTGWTETTETYLGIMTECEINSSKFSTSGKPWIANGGIFHQLVVDRSGNSNKLGYIRLGGKVYVKQFYPGNHDDNAYTTTLCPVIVSGGEIEECYMTGRKETANTIGSVHFWCNGGLMHKFLGAYMEPNHGDVTAQIDHAIFRRFFGGGTNKNKPVEGNITITINHSLVDFFCGGPEFGDMSSGKEVKVYATGTTFGQYYGAGFGGTSLYRTRTGQNATVGFSTSDVNFPLAFTNYTSRRLQYNNGYGASYGFEFFPYSGGSGTGVARFYVDYASLSLAQTGNVTSELTDCIILNDFYAGGCQGRVSGNTSARLMNCKVQGNVFGGGYTAAITSISVYPTTQPTYSVYKGATGTFTPFGTVVPETYTWVSGSNGTVSGKTLATSVDMTTMGEVTGNSTVYVGGASQVNGGVYGGGNASDVNGNSTVTIEATSTYKINNVYGGANQANVGTNSAHTTTVNIHTGKVGRVFGGNNQSGIKSGTITVNASGAESDSIYGGGNLAAYTGNPVVNISGEAKVKFDVFGGGLGSTAVITGTPVVNVSGGIINGSVYGGGSAADVTGGGNVTIDNTASTDTISVGKVFGGGKRGIITQSTQVTVDGTAHVVHSVYGGGEQADVQQNATVNIQGGTVGEHVFGGGDAGNISGNTQVTVTDGSIEQNVYGGGNQGDVSGQTNVRIGNN